MWTMFPFRHNVRQMLRHANRQRGCGRQWMRSDQMLNDMVHSHLWQQHPNSHPWCAAEEHIGMKETNTHVYINVDTHEYRPEDISIEVNGQRVVIKGREETGSKDDETWHLRQFKQEFLLPDNVEVGKLEADMAPDGHMMTVAVPKKEPHNQEEPKKVPIKISFNDESK